MLTPPQVRDVVAATTSNIQLATDVFEVIDSVDLRFESREQIFNFVHAINKLRIKYNA